MYRIMHSFAPQSPPVQLIRQTIRMTTTAVSSTNGNPKPNKILSVPDGMNRALQSMEYAVRGALVQRAEEISLQLKDPTSAATIPFSNVVYCNIGNPQSVGQSPITYNRQVLSGIVCPSLLRSEIFPPDVTAHIRMLLGHSNGVGAYTESPGLRFLRERIADALQKRDGVPCSVDNLFLTNGASEGAKTMLGLLVRSPKDGVMIPTPQYPLYSATMTALKGVQVSYYLDEEDGWSLSVAELKRSLEEAQRKGVCVRALVVINPGNPTGQVLSRQNQMEVVRFCEDNNLVILADEVYQKNVYVEDKPFTSFKKIAVELEANVELASFHSVSKGMYGECGIRGGYLELYNMSDDARAMVYKVQSVSLCSNVLGQVATELMMRPPEQGDPSYKGFKRETEQIFNSLKRKSLTLQNALNTFEGVHCNRSEGAMYLFPRITLPAKAIAEAERRGLASADVLYCFDLLEATGICVVPGSGFGQRDGTYHFRITFLPTEEEIDEVVQKMRKFHHEFLDKYL